ncbi:unnamed protein product [Ambrosiozyma monospora]|uniref:Unnamed protein product n=1 Tax=Ambrosiozyma monospora TaxID=43982 RepID=A0A9W7DFW3_AMBMO|nr:unnamed protein product [Ambrosiozyma monospora]
MTIQRVSNHKRQRTLRNHEIVVIDTDTDSDNDNDSDSKSHHNTNDNDNETNTSDFPIIDLVDDTETSLQKCNDGNSTSDSDDGNYDNDLNHSVASRMKRLDHRKHRFISRSRRSSRPISSSSSSSSPSSTQNGKAEVEETSDHDDHDTISYRDSHQLLVISQDQYTNSNFHSHSRSHSHSHSVSSLSSYKSPIPPSPPASSLPTHTITGAIPAPTPAPTPAPATECIDNSTDSENEDEVITLRNVEQLSRHFMESIEANRRLGRLKMDVQRDYYKDSLEITPVSCAFDDIDGIDDVNDIDDPEVERDIEQWEDQEAAGSSLEVVAWDENVVGDVGCLDGNNQRDEDQCECERVHEHGDSDVYDNDKESFKDNYNDHEEEDDDDHDDHDDIKIQNQQLYSTQATSTSLMSSDFQDVQKPVGVTVTHDMMPTPQSQSQKSSTTVPTSSVSNPVNLTENDKTSNDTAVESESEFKSESNHQIPETGGCARHQRCKTEKVNFKYGSESGSGCAGGKVGNGGGSCVTLSGGQGQDRGQDGYELTVVKRRLKRIRVGLSRRAKVDPLHPKLVERYRQS